MLNLRRYNGRILFVPAPGYEEVGDPVEQTTGHETNGVSGATDKNGETCGYVGPSIKEADLRWRSLNGPFVSVWLGNVPFASEDAMAAPKAEVGQSLAVPCPAVPLRSIALTLSCLLPCSLRMATWMLL
jgi:sphingosine kinase